MHHTFTTEESIVLPAGAELSYSAGRRSSDPLAFRQIGHAEYDLQELLVAIPHVADMLTKDPPIVISCYPARTFREVKGAVFVDTYLRPETVSRALLLAASQGRSAIVIGQPLPILDLVLQHIQKGLNFPPENSHCIWRISMPKFCGSNAQWCA